MSEKTFYIVYTLDDRYTKYFSAVETDTLEEAEEYRDALIKSSGIDAVKICKVEEIDKVIVNPNPNA